MGNCVIPVGGGKDRITLVVRMFEPGVKSLCITATTYNLSEIRGEDIKNIEKEEGIYAVKVKRAREVYF